MTKVLSRDEKNMPNRNHMKTTTDKVKKVDVLRSSEELAQIMKKDPSFIEKDLIQQGDQILGIFTDESFRGSFKNFDKMKIEAIKMAIEDIACGAPTLMSSTIGLTFKNNKIQTYIVPFGTMASGNVMFSINLKNRAAFKSWRDQEATDFAQEEVNTAIYRLTTLWSALI